MGTEFDVKGDPMSPDLVSGSPDDSTDATRRPEKAKRGKSRRNRTAKKTDPLENAGQLLNDPAFQKIATEFANEWGQAHTSHTEAMYPLSWSIREVKENARYGSNGVRVLAERVGVSRSYLYGMAKVAEVWEPERFHEIMQMRNARGQPLTWTHLIMIAEHTNTDANDVVRKEMLALWESESLSVEKLRATFLRQTLETANDRGADAGDWSRVDELSNELRDAAKGWTLKTAGLVAQLNSTTPMLNSSQQQKLNALLVAARSARKVSSEVVKAVEAVLKPVKIVSRVESITLGGKTT